MARPSSAKIAREIIEREPRFAPVIERSGLSPIGSGQRRESNFRSLATSIISQQLSGKAAATIIGRVDAITGGITPRRINETSIAKLRSAGLSGSKARAISELAEAESEIRFSRLHLIEDDEEIYRRLLPLFGVGRWTVEMFLIFQLGRIDIWPTGDLGVRRGWEKVHRLRSEISPQELERKGEKFRPYRSHLAWYCWRALE
jgi:DNA-3-methyladenine glycosylase II